MNALLALSRLIDRAQRADRPRRSTGSCSGRRADQRRQRHRPQDRSTRARTRSSRSSGICSRRSSCFCAGYTLLHNEHVRIDVITGRLSARARAWIDIFGTLFFLLPMAILIMWLSWPVFVDAYERHEVSTNAGGLIIWPARLHGADRLLPADPAGDLGADQAHRVPAGHDSRPEREARHEDRGGAARRGNPASARRARHAPSEIEGIGQGSGGDRHDRLPHREHGAADVRGAGGRSCCSATRSPSRSAPIGHRRSACSASSSACCSRRCSRRCRSGSGGSCRTTRCSRCRSSRSWG